MVSTGSGQRGNGPAAIILAAGKGTRMNSSLPKVLHTLQGIPLVVHVMQAAVAAGCTDIVIVVGYEAQAVQEGVKPHIPQGLRVEFALQTEQLGTGHAVIMAEEALINFEGDVFLLPGDVPLIRGSTLAALLAEHRQQEAEVTVLSSVLRDAKHYGRIVRDAKGQFTSIVEAKDCSEKQLAIGEFNTGAFVVRSPSCFELLKQVDTDNAQGEYYVTDLVAIALANGRRAAATAKGDHAEMLGINDQSELAAAEVRMAARQS